MAGYATPQSEEELRLLVIEDDPMFAAALEVYIEGGFDDSFEFVHFETLAQGLDELGRRDFDILFLDLFLPDSKGLATLEEALSVENSIPTIVFTAHEDDEFALEAMRLGAYDYLVKMTLRDIDVVRSIRYARERARMLQELTTREARFRGTFDRAPVGIAHVSMGWDFLMVNEACCELLGYGKNALLRKNLCDLLPSTIARGIRYEGHRLLSGELAHFTTEATYHSPNGTFWFRLSLSLMPADFVSAACYIVILEDVTAQKNAELSLRKNAMFDSLTGLPNRSHLRECLTQSLARFKRHEEYHFAVLFLDIDRFKTVNDSLGHMTGDELLIEVSKRLHGILRGEDMVARWGGDEFIILLDSIDSPEDARRVAERIIQQVFAAPFSIQDRELFVSTSIGVLNVNDEYNGAEEMLRDADIAMYRAKDLGRSRYVVFQESMRNQVFKKLQLDSAIRRAIERAELSLHYQPIVHLGSGRLKGFEALVRWIHPQKGMISPGDFLPLAEETGFICSIDRWVLREACLQLRKWHDLLGDETLTISVNLSSLHFGRDEIVRDVERCLEESGILPHCLHLEITESAIIKNQHQATPILMQLKGCGVCIDMDDFGTGYSSLSYLQHFPLDVLKVDRSFVFELGQNPKQEKIVELITVLAQTIGLKVVAEGIETDEHRKMLIGLKCDFGQGYYFSKPLQHDAVTQLLMGETEANTFEL